MLQTFMETSWATVLILKDLGEYALCVEVNSDTLKPIGREELAVLKKDLRKRK